MTFVYWTRMEERVQAPARFIMAMFFCPPTRTGSMSLTAFIARCINKTQLPVEVLAGALVILHRLHALNPDHQGSSGHRLFLAAYMISSKLLCDCNFSNETWLSVGRGVEGLDLQQVNRIERELLHFVDWNIGMTLDDLEKMDRTLEDLYTIQYFPSPPHSPVPLPAAREEPVASSSSPSLAMSSSLSMESIYSYSSSTSSIIASDSYFPSPRTPSTPFSPFSPPSSSSSSKVFRSHLAPLHLASSTESSHSYSKNHLSPVSSMDAPLPLVSEEEQPRRRRQPAGVPFISFYE